MSARRAAERDVCEAARQLREYQRRSERDGNHGSDELLYVQALDRALANLVTHTRARPKGGAR